MKLSILTATYNRGEFLKRLYESILNNLIDDMDVEWLIMDDGSTDDTNEVVQEFQQKKNFEIKLYKQENQGKMNAINNLMEYITGELCIECDSDDFFAENALKIINNKYKIIQENQNLYALVFLKNEYKGKLSGNYFLNENIDTTMFDLYFKKNITGEKIIIYNSSIRKKYKYLVEEGEKFCTEARLHHQMDQKYKIRCYNEVLIEGEYQADGYTSNMNKIFIENPKGFYEYFKEILKLDMSNVIFKKRIYVIKHYILFAYLSKAKIKLSDANSIINKYLIIVMYIPGILKSVLFAKKYGRRKMKDYKKM